MMSAAEVYLRYNLVLERRHIRKVDIEYGSHRYLAGRDQGMEH